MSHLGFFSFLGRGHLNPAAALARRMIARGHSVTFFHLTIAQAAVRAAGLRFWPIDQQENTTPPKSSRDRYFRHRTTIEAVDGQTTRLLREGPSAIRDTRVDALVVDQLDLAGGTLAEVSGIPFVTLSCSPPMHLNALRPPTFFKWQPSAGMISRLRNRFGNSVIEYCAGPILARLNEQRRKWGLQAFHGFNDSLSTRAVITQLPRALEFPDVRVADNLFYAGQLRDDWDERHALSPKFPWERLDGRPLIYASMGTIRNDIPAAFSRIAEACSRMQAQLVISLGGGTLRPKDLASLPGDPIVVHYAPQLDLIRRAKLTINCAGLNTTLDSLACGLPMVAIPVAEDQPGVAARIEEAGVGKVIPLRRLTTSRLRRAVEGVYAEDSGFRMAASRLQSEIAGIDGCGIAAGVVERSLSLQ